MSYPPAMPVVLSPDDPTLDAIPRPGMNPPESIDSASPSGLSPACAALVEGSAPELSRETQSLLQSRLRLAAGVLFAGFGAFWVQRALHVDYADSADVWILAFHGAVTATLGLAAGLLSWRDAMPLWQLRTAELTVFGLAGLFALVVQYLYVLVARQNGRFDFPEGLWLVLIFTYALFIPNTRRRAAVVIGLMVVVPLICLVGLVWWYPPVAKQITSDEFTGIVLMFALAGGAAVFGVDVIGSLRREVFEARQLGQYRLTECIGAGGMGEVYLAEHRLLKRPCVVKLIRPDKTGNPKVVARFQREVRATAKLSHWNTVEIYDYGCTDNGTFFYVMEYLPGLGLGKLVEQFGPMPPERVIFILRQACAALGEAHAGGLIPRDIKPGNIFLCRRGGVDDVAKLLDFGLVKPLLDEEPVDLTADGAITGSPLFMSPEQALGDAKPDARSDIYSLGAVAYYLLTRRPPFQGDRPLKVLFAHAHELPTPPSVYRPDLPADLERVVMRCLEKNPADRYQTAAELDAALASCRAASLWNHTLAAQWWNHYMPNLA